MKLRVEDLARRHFSDPISCLPLNAAMQDKLRGFEIRTVRAFALADRLLLREFARAANEEPQRVLQMANALWERWLWLEAHGETSPSAPASDSQLPWPPHAAEDPDVPVTLAQAASRLESLVSDLDLEARLVPRGVLDSLDRIPISELKLSVRAHNCLEGERIHTVGQLAAQSPNRLLRIAWFGETSLQDVLKKLAAYLRHAALAEAPAGDDIKRTGAQNAQTGLVQRTEVSAPTVGRLRVDYNRCIERSETVLAALSDPMSDDVDGTAPLVPLGLLGELASVPIDFEALSVRAKNCLKYNGIHYLGDLAAKSRNDLMGIRNFGRTSLREVCEYLRNALVNGWARADLIDATDAAGASHAETVPSRVQTTPTADTGAASQRLPIEILRTHALEHLSTAYDRADAEDPLVPSELLGTAGALAVDALELSVRPGSRLRRLGCNTISDVAALSPAELMSVDGFGRGSLTEVCEQLCGVLVEHWCSDPAPSQVPSEDTDEPERVPKSLLLQCLGRGEDCPDFSRIECGRAIATLELSGVTQTAIEVIGLTSDAPLSDLGRVTLGDMAASLPVEVLQEIVDSWMAYVDETAHERLIEYTRGLTELPIVDGVQSIVAVEKLRGERIGSLAVAVLGLDEPVLALLADLGVATLDDLPQATEAELLALSGDDLALTAYALRSVRAATGILVRDVLDGACPCYVTPNLYSLLSELIGSVSNSTIWARNAEIYMKRCGLGNAGSGIPTYETLAREYGLTRARVQQIISRTEAKLRSERIRRGLAPLMRSLQSIAAEHGDIVEAETLGPLLRARWGWNGVPSTAALGLLLRILADEHDAPISLATPSRPHGRRTVPESRQGGAASGRQQRIGTSAALRSNPLRALLADYVTRCLGDGMSQRDRDIVLATWALDGMAWKRSSIDTMAARMGLSRDYVQQLVDNAREQCSREPEVLELHRFSQVIAGVCETGLGCCTLRHARDALASTFGWAPGPTDCDIRLLSELTGKLLVEDGIVRHVNSCERLREAVLEHGPRLASENGHARKLINFAHDLTIALRDECDGDCRDAIGPCPLAPGNNGQCIPVQYLECVLPLCSPPILTSDGQKVVSPRLLPLTEAKSQRDVVGAALAYLGVPTYYADVARVVREHSAKYADMSDKQVQLALINSPTCKSTGDGTYVLDGWEVEQEATCADAVERVVRERGRALSISRIVEVLEPEGYNRGMIERACRDERFVEAGAGIVDLRERNDTKSGDADSGGVRIRSGKSSKGTIKL